MPFRVFIWSLGSLCPVVNDVENTIMSIPIWFKDFPLSHLLLPLKHLGSVIQPTPLPS